MVDFTPEEVYIEGKRSESRRETFILFIGHFFVYDLIDDEFYSTQQHDATLNMGYTTLH